jgi:hypothetical protein
MNQCSNRAVPGATLDRLVVCDQHSDLRAQLLLREASLPSQLRDAPPEVVDDSLRRLFHPRTIGLARGRLKHDNNHVFVLEEALERR